MTGGVTYYNGNGGIGVDSTEIYRDDTWTIVGKLPGGMGWWGLSATSFDNKVLLFGNDKNDKITLNNRALCF